jgi:excinuclease ABC subunit C
VSQTSTDLNLKLKLLPELPGVYQFVDVSGTIIYVGKAKNLKKRVGSYFSKKQENGKTFMLVKKIADLRYTVVNSEMDAFLLENNLIKEYQPKYNIQLKDDKTYPWICIKNEAFPRVFSTRKLIRDGSQYFGPYPNGKVLQTILHLIKSNYKLRTCSLDLSDKNISKNKFKVCLEYHIGNCLGPCAAHQTKENYLQQIKEITSILKGNVGAVIQTLKKDMLEFASKYEFEKAQEVKLRIDALDAFRVKSTVVSASIKEVDVVTILNEENIAFINYMCVKNGSIIHSFTSSVKKILDETFDEILIAVLPTLRERFNSESKEILIEQTTAIFLEGITFSVPQKGEKKQLVELSKNNTIQRKLEYNRQEKLVNPERHTDRILNQIKNDFKLKELPIHMECFDNSNIQGTNAVSACVVFRDAKPSKKDYRHFNIKTVEGPNDFASMEEVIYRRYKRIVEENQTLPQLIIIDGGKGQLSAALNALETLNLRGKVAIVGIAKRLEELFFPGDSLPIYLDKRSESLKVIQFMRNEAHRFGITHHRSKRSKAAIQSELTEIKGVGSATQELLIKKFKTVKAIKHLDIDALTQAVGESKAKIIFDYFHQEIKN